MKQLNLGIIGLGRAGGGMHLNELKGKEDMFRIYAVCDIESDRLEKMNKLYGAKMYKRVEDIVEDPEIEVIDIATRSCDHFVHAMTALQAGKTVFLEKPITMNYDEAKKLFAYADSIGKNKLFIRHNRRFEAKFMEAQRIIDSGILGDVYYVKRSVANFDRRADWQTLSQYGGGQLLNWGPHLVDQALRFCGGEYKRMNSYTRQVAAAGDCEDVVLASFEGINGRIVEIEISGGVTIPGPNYVLYGTRGTLVDRGDTYEMKYLPTDYVFPPIKSSAHTPKGQNFGSTDPLPFVTEEKTWETNKLDHVWGYLYEAVREGKEYPIKSEEALKVMEVITEIKRQNAK
jgi:predicted dehydrogenase